VKQDRILLQINYIGGVQTDHELKAKLCPNDGTWSVRFSGRKYFVKRDHLGAATLVLCPHCMKPGCYKRSTEGGIEWFCYFCSVEKTAVIRSIIIKNQRGREAKEAGAFCIACKRNKEIEAFIPANFPEGHDWHIMRVFLFEDGRWKEHGGREQLKLFKGG